MKPKHKKKERRSEALQSLPSLLFPCSNSINYSKGKTKIKTRKTKTKTKQNKTKNQP